MWSFLYCRGARQPPQGCHPITVNIFSLHIEAGNKHQIPLHLLSWLLGLQGIPILLAETSIKQLCFWRDVISGNIFKLVALKVLSQKRDCTVPRLQDWCHEETKQKKEWKRMSVGAEGDNSLEEVLIFPSFQDFDLNLLSFQPGMLKTNFLFPHLLS